MTENNEPITTELVLGSELNIYEVAIVREQIEKIVEQHHSIDIDISDISEIDTSGVQLLLALDKQDLFTCHFKGVSEPVNQALQTFKIKLKGL